MIFEDWHTHSSLCRHAIGNLEDYIKAAISKKLSLIGLSAHFPYEFLSGIDHLKYQEYAMPLVDVEKYISTALILKKKYEKQIQVKIGFEVDYIKNQVEKHRAYLKPFFHELDYIIGSIHNLHTEFMGLFAFDDFRCLPYYKNYENIDDLFLAYYETLKEMVISVNFDFNIIGHLDLPKKFDKHPENEDLILKNVSEILKLVKKRGYVIELNSSGLRKPINEQYPSEKILYLMSDLDIDVVLGSDAHHPDEIAYEFNRMHQLLKECGFTRLSHFDHQNKSYINI